MQPLPNELRQQPLPNQLGQQLIKPPAEADCYVDPESNAVPLALCGPSDPSLRHLGEDGDLVPEDKCEWAAFISHHQAHAGTQVLWLGERIEKKLKDQGKRLTKVYVDKKERATQEDLREGVRCCRNFIMFMTKQLLSRLYCCNEIRMALKYRKNVIIVYQTDERHGGVRGSFADYYGPELKKAFPNADDYSWLMKNSCVQFDDRERHVDVMLHGLLDRMELLPLPADPSSAGNLCNGGEGRSLVGEWQFESDNGWVAMDDTLSDQLEADFKRARDPSSLGCSKKPSVAVVKHACAGHAYEFDLETMQQRNVRTNKVRRIMRMEVEARGCRESPTLELDFSDLLDEHKEAQLLQLWQRRLMPVRQRNFCYASVPLDSIEGQGIVTAVSASLSGAAQHHDAKMPCTQHACARHAMIHSIQQVHRSRASWRRGESKTRYAPFGVIYS
jgi:hypothetical protein